MCPYNPQAIPFWHDILMLLLRKQLQRDFPLMVFLKPINEASFYSWSSRFPSSRTCHKSKVSQEKLLSLVTMLRFDLTCLQPNFFLRDCAEIDFRLPFIGHRGGLRSAAAAEGLLRRKQVPVLSIIDYFSSDVSQWFPLGTIKDKQVFKPYLLLEIQLVAQIGSIFFLL